MQYSANATVQNIGNLLLFSFSDKAKFAIKVSLSVLLVYLISFSQGWPEARTAALTVMIIAAIGAAESSVKKAVYRVVETVAGAAMGLILIGLFPQDRMLYLLSASVIVAILTYFSRAYRGDTTLFMLSALTLLMMFDNGEIDDVFTYGLGRTSMIIFGIAVYALVSMLLWPVSPKDNSIENAVALTATQSDLYVARAEGRVKRNDLYHELLSGETLMGKSFLGSSDAVGEMGFSVAQWQNIVFDYQKIDRYLTLLSCHDQSSVSDSLSRYVSNYHTIDKEISELFKAITMAWNLQKEIEIPILAEPKYHTREIEGLSDLQYAALVSTIGDMQKLHTQLRKLSEKLNTIISPKPTFFELEQHSKPSVFLWFDIEDLKGTLVTFLIFWAATLIWITINPPGTPVEGFMIVTMATALSAVTTYNPLNPSKMIILFTFSSLFAVSLYIFVLPHLHYVWELGLFIFFYTFVGFYFFKYKLSLFFMLGFVALDILNRMNYNFDILSLSLFIIYAFLTLLLFFYYIPFSTKPEYLFLTMKKRFFRFSQILMVHNRNINAGKESVIGALKAKYSEMHIVNTVKKMYTWAMLVDTEYFNTVEKKALIDFTKECQSIVYLLKILYHEELRMRDNPLLKRYKVKYNGEILIDLLGDYASGKSASDGDSLREEQNKEQKMVIEKIDESLKEIISGIHSDECSQKERADFYEILSLRRNVWLSFLNCQEMMTKIDFKALEASRF